MVITSCGPSLTDQSAAESYMYSITQMTSLDSQEGMLSDEYASNSYYEYEPLMESPLEGLTYSYTYRPSSDADRSKWRYTYLDEDGREYAFDVMGRLIGWSSWNARSPWNIGIAKKRQMRRNAEEILSDLQIVLPEPYKDKYDMKAQGVTSSWCCTTEITPTIILEGEEGTCEIRYTQKGVVLDVYVEYTNACKLSCEDRNVFEQLLQDQLDVEDYNIKTVCYKKNGDVHTLFMIEIKQEDGSIGTECYVAAKTKKDVP